MKKTILLTAIALSCGILVSGCAEETSVSTLQGEESPSVVACRRPPAPVKTIINADPHGRVTLQGYDPVAFHTVGMAVRGSPSILSEYLGYKYLFASEENRSLFEADPERYLPAYGGFCAYGVSLGVLFPVEIGTWVIINGRLILQFSQEFRQIFEENTEENLLKADANWLEMTRKKPGRH